MANADPLPLKPAQLLQDYAHLLKDETLSGPVLDLASGDCTNAIYLAQSHVQIIACDISGEALDRGRQKAAAMGLAIESWQVDLEREGTNPLQEDFYGAIVIFRYLHRALIPAIRKALKDQGILIYETFTIDQPRFGRPHNPEYLLKPGELHEWFKDWRIIHYFEGIKQDPARAVAQIVCQKRSGTSAP